MQQTIRYREGQRFQLGDAVYVYRNGRFVLEEGASGGMADNAWTMPGGVHGGQAIDRSSGPNTGLAETLEDRILSRHDMFASYRRPEPGGIDEVVPMLLTPGTAERRRRMFAGSLLGGDMVSPEGYSPEGGPQPGLQPYRQLPWLTSSQWIDRLEPLPPRPYGPDLVSWHEPIRWDELRLRPRDGPAWERPRMSSSHGELVRAWDAPSPPADEPPQRREVRPITTRDDPRLAGVNRQFAAMYASPRTTEAAMAAYLDEYGIEPEQIPNWRRAMEHRLTERFERWAALPESQRPRHHVNLDDVQLPEDQHYVAEIAPALPTDPAPDQSMEQDPNSVVVIGHRDGASRHRLGSLSEQYETGGRGPGTVSTGTGDRGGVSYGSFQLATEMEQPHQFLRGEGGRWAPEFGVHQPGSAEFSRKWREIAAREPEAFFQAQYDYIHRTHYAPAVEIVNRQTGIDLEGMSDAVRNAAWSTSVHHRKAPQLLSDAVSAADRLVDRDAADYEEVLINKIYDRRTEYLNGMIADPGTRASNRRTFRNIVSIRFPQERRDALRMLGKDE